MPNISPRTQRSRKPGKSRKKAHGQNARATKNRGLSHKHQRTLVPDACDEIDRVCDLLRAAPLFHMLARMVRQIDEKMPPEQRDEIARFAKKHYDYDIDRLIEQPHEMTVIDELPDALAATARWRLERLGKALYRGLRGKE
jgi:hypothetical protein